MLHLLAVVVPPVVFALTTAILGTLSAWHLVKWLAAAQALLVKHRTDVIAGAIGLHSRERRVGQFGNCTKREPRSPQISDFIFHGFFPLRYRRKKRPAFAGQIENNNFRTPN